MSTHIPNHWRALLLALCLVLVIFGFSLAPPPLSAAACTTTVPAAGDIQAAINAASPYDVVCLSAGTYTPASTLVIPIPLTLQGPQFDVDPRPGAGSARTPGGPGEAIIDGGGTLGTIIQISASNAVLNGFEVKNGTGDLIVTPTGGAVFGIRVAYLIVHDATGDEGLQIRDCENCVIEYNYVYDIFGDGINLCCGSTGGLIQFNETTDIDSENAAIYVYDAESTTIQCNLIDGTSQNEGIKFGAKYGLDAQKTGGQILYNTITNTAQDGIAVYMSHTSIEGNDISYSSSENGAIYVTHGVINVGIAYNTIHDNTFSLLKWTPGGVTVGNSDGQLAYAVFIGHNNFYGNNPLGVLNLAPDLLKAEYNWWGDASGPGPAGPGTGDGVSTNVDFEPWLAQPADIPASPCDPPGTITVVKSAEGGGDTEFEFDPSWSDENFFLKDGQSVTSPPLQTGDYTVDEVQPPAGWSLYDATCDNLSTTDVETYAPFNLFVENGEEWVCTFTNVFTPPTGTIIIVKEAIPADNTLFGFTHDIDTSGPFDLQDPSADIKVFDDMPLGNYTVTEDGEPGWTLDAINCIDPTDNSSGNTATRQVSIGLDADETVTCTFTNVYNPPITNTCPEEFANSSWTDLLGIGMGNMTSHKVQAKVVIPNWLNSVDLYGQLVAKNMGAANYVRFLYPGLNNFVQVNAITSFPERQAGTFWYGADLDPAAHIRGRWFLMKSGTNRHIPRALVLYPTYNDPLNTYVNVWDTFEAFEGEVDWNVAAGWVPYREIVVPIAAPLGETDFHVELAVADNDNDQRPVWVTVSAGGVSQTQQPLGPNKAPLLNLMVFDLKDVPAGTDEIVIEIYSPSKALDGVIGDSATLVGMVANYQCEALGED